MLRYLLVLIAVVCSVACSPSSAPQTLVGTDISGADFANQLNLTNHLGQSVTLSSYQGKVVALFFGYTHCPDVCPTTLHDLASALKLLGDKAKDVQVLFVTLDPERDTQEVLAKFVPSFNPSFVGLYGTPQAVDETAKNFKIFYSKQNVAGKSGYLIDHSAGVYLYDKSGKIRVYVKFGQKPAEIANDIETIL